MEVSHKRKRADADGGGSVSDRLSELPDCLLEEILSGLKARQVVQTCVLSSRWRRLWLTVPRLDIDAAEFTSTEELDKMEEDMDKFEDFVDNLLSRRGSSPLHTLRIRIAGSEGYKVTTYGRWVRRGLLFFPAELDVGMEGPPGGTIAMPSLAATGHRLTKLRLDRVVLHRDFAELLASGLPVMRHLEIINSALLHSLPRIVSASLESLAVVRSRRPRPDVVAEGGPATLDIVAPRLASLQIIMPFSYLICRAIALGDAPSLVRASVVLLHTTAAIVQRAVESNTDKVAAGLGKLLRSLHNAATLELSGFRGMKHGGPHPILQAILNEELPVFPYLRTMTLDTSDVGDIQMVQRFLRNNTPILDKLTLKNS